MAKLSDTHQIQVAVDPMDKFLVFLQRLIPARAIGNLIYVLSRSQTVWFKNAFINVFARIYKVDTSEAEFEVPRGYKSFNDFFTRELLPNARPVHGNSQSLVSPADGTVAQSGHASGGTLIQAKGMTFGAATLLADAQLAASLSESAFVTIYLAPYNYHRLHMPLDGRLVSTAFIPGKLYSVNARTTANVPQLYAINERLVCHFESEHGPFAMVLVGAMNVASISTAWGGEIPSPRDGSIQREKFSNTDKAPYLQRGDYMGHFNMGSTIVLLGPPASLKWIPALETGMSIRVGEEIGRIADHT